MGAEVRVDIVVAFIFVPLKISLRQFSRRYRSPTGVSRRRRAGIFMGKSTLRRNGGVSTMGLVISTWPMKSGAWSSFGYGKPGMQRAKPARACRPLPTGLAVFATEMILSSRDECGF